MLAEAKHKSSVRAGSGRSFTAYVFSKSSTAQHAQRASSAAASAAPLATPPPLSPHRVIAESLSPVSDPISAVATAASAAAAAASISHVTSPPSAVQVSVRSKPAAAAKSSASHAPRTAGAVHVSVQSKAAAIVVEHGCASVERFSSAQVCETETQGTEHSTYQGRGVNYPTSSSAERDHCRGRGSI